MDSQSPKMSKAGWLAKFAFYLVLFTLLISLGAFFFTNSTEAPSALKPVAPSSATPPPATQTMTPPLTTPTVETPAGLAGHAAPQAK